MRDSPGQEFSRWEYADSHTPEATVPIVASLWYGQADSAHCLSLWISKKQSSILYVTVAGNKSAKEENILLQ